MPLTGVLVPAVTPRLVRVAAVPPTTRLLLPSCELSTNRPLVSMRATTPVVVLCALILLRMEVAVSASTKAMLVPLMVKLPALPTPSV